MFETVPFGRTSLSAWFMGETEGNADLAQEFFRRSFDGETDGFFHGTTLVGTYNVPTSDAPDFEQRAEAVAEKMVRDISNS